MTGVEDEITQPQLSTLATQFFLARSSPGGTKAKVFTHSRTFPPTYGFLEGLDTSDFENPALPNHLEAS